MTNIDDTPDGFSGLGLNPKLLDALTALGYEEPTPIQRESIPPLIEGRDLLGQAATGTGKTAAFALPLLHQLAERGSQRGPTALVLVPTRELAMQVAEAVYRYGRALDAQVLPVYGGQAITRQLRALERGVDVVVATPGRALDHIRRGSLRLDAIRMAVLDEADEMLDMGFAEDIEAILSEAPEQRQTVLFSATMPARVAGIAKRHLQDPVRIQIAREPVAPGEVPRIRQTAYVVPRAHKLAALGRVLDLESPTAGIVFCRTRNEVDQLAEALTARGYRTEALHGGMSQEQRDRVMRKLRSGATELLIATDVAARGLDVEHLSHVINYDVPSASESYVHRIGRVGRAGREGVAITLAEPREHRLLRNIERLTRQRIEVAGVPTVADLRTRRLELTRAAVREAAMSGDTDQYRVVVEALAGELDMMEIALAALKVAHEATGGEEADEQGEIPDTRFQQPRASEEERPQRGRRGEAPARPAGRQRGPRQGAMTTLHIGAGRNAGIRPQDLVGAIANEAGVDRRNIGAIEITDRFSLVEVADEVVREVADALRASTIRGKRVTVRRDRDRRDEPRRSRPPR